jgi:Uma2 family endonuclease
MSASPHPRLTEDEYLRIERAAEFKSEFYDGRMYAMSGGSSAHALIIPNLAAELRNALKQKPCTVYVTELRLRVVPRGSYTYPDVTVVCGPPAFADNQKDTLLNPTLIVEVLSPSTEAHDRGLKFAQYRQIESLQEYGLVSQSEPRVEIFRRQPSGDWLLSEFIGLDATCSFHSVDCRISLSEIYFQVVFDTLS